ncbi:hypothetical protein L2E82_18630 [Cichorium intybus]|uniref:Uncharacterized protein n=1 Tax=Cichorium intybus TaxID=13427 RepID=A0ACB9FA35_CICIN|nr:hypothetical protein L2E82_18630 [Cichorium intybus]
MNDGIQETSKSEVKGGEQIGEACLENSSPETMEGEVGVNGTSIGTQEPAYDAPIDIPDDKSISNPATSQTAILGHSENSFGPIKKLVPLECFGPFPSPFVNQQNTQPQRRSLPLNKEYDEPQNRKRKRLAAECAFVFNTQTNKEKSPTIPTTGGDAMDTAKSQSLDLNRNPLPYSSENTCTESSSVNEIIKTVEIGTEELMLAEDLEA